MQPKKILFIIGTANLSMCASAFIFPSFFIPEVLKNYEASCTEVIHQFYFVAVSNGCSISALTLFGARLDNKGARVLLKGIALISMASFVVLMVQFMTTPFRVPIFMIFSLLIFSIYAFINSNNTKYDYLD